MSAESAACTPSVADAGVGSNRRHNYYSAADRRRTTRAHAFSTASCGLVAACSSEVQLEDDIPKGFVMDARDVCATDPGERVAPRADGDCVWRSWRPRFLARVQQHYCTASVDPRRSTTATSRRRAALCTLEGAAGMLQHQLPVCSHHHSAGERQLRHPSEPSTEALIVPSTSNTRKFTETALKVNIT